MDDLTSEEQRALDIELAYQGRPRRAKANAVHALGWTINHYCLLLSQALNKPSTLLEHPDLVRRYQNHKDQRARERFGGARR